MTRVSTLTLALFGVILFATGCDRPVCKNTNPVFDKYSPDTKAYKDELVKQLATVDRSKLSYWMDTYRRDGKSQQILAHIQGAGLCAKILLTIEGSEKGIEDLLAKKGKSYSGAGLRDLEFDIKQDDTSTVFIFKEVSGIWD